MNPHYATRAFEIAVAEYCGSRFAVSVNSCTAALLLCCAYHEVGEVEIPKLTYVGVAQSILNAGGTVKFRDEDWQGAYRLEPYNIVDAARRFHASMHKRGDFTCISLHISKICGCDQGGVILHDDPIADPILRKMRFDGRTEGILRATIRLHAVFIATFLRVWPRKLCGNSRPSRAGMPTFPGPTIQT